MLEVDAAGLDRLDRALLRSIVEKFDGGPVGLSTLAVSVGEEADTIEDVYEPYLLQRGLIKRTPRGAGRHVAPHTNTSDWTCRRLSPGALAFSNGGEPPDV